MEAGVVTTFPHEGHACLFLDGSRKLKAHLERRSFACPKLDWMKPAGQSLKRRKEDMAVRHRQRKVTRASSRHPRMDVQEEQNEHLGESWKPVNCVSLTLAMCRPHDQPHSQPASKLMDSSRPPSGEQAGDAILVCRTDVVLSSLVAYVDADAAVRSRRRGKLHAEQVALCRRHEMILKDGGRARIRLVVHDSGRFLRQARGSASFVGLLDSSLGTNDARCGCGKVTGDECSARYHHLIFAKAMCVRWRQVR